MTSQRDWIDGVITVVFLLLVGGLAFTGHDTGALGTGLIGGLGAVFSYWFTRSGVSIGQGQPVTQQPTVDPVAIAQAVAPAVVAGLTQAATTPAQGVPVNENTIPGSSGN